ncbi:hypothetical protein [Nitrosomonas sp. Is37]|uniref:hypothetical protein n=1 Tax=Nitrosomonas sp. Is37 TaxID=3080535 RepID=UPI00294AB94B|nr:hypothetical protein [Nitrosomonas sp. Is37]MDV6344997.1 hypothetical protein [Nitrosomonas sp. Is37]
MEASNFWKYLDNIWILTGLVLVIVVSLLKMLSVNNLNSRKSKQQLQKGINYLFVLGITGMALGILFSQNSNLTAPQQTNNDLLDSVSFPNHDVKSQSLGTDTGAAVDASGSAGINQQLLIKSGRTRPERPDTVNQQSKEDSSMTANTSKGNNH